MSIAERAASYVRLTAPVVTLTQVVDGNLRDRYRATDELVVKTLEGHKTYAAKVHTKCNGYLKRLRYGKRRNNHMQVREDLLNLRAEAAKLLTEKKEPVTHPVVVQEWEESEAGWGVRPDGASLHRTESDRQAYVKDFWEKERKRNPGGETPAEYSRESGKPFVMDVDAATYKKVLASTNGIMLWQSDYSALKTKGK